MRPAATDPFDHVRRLQKSPELVKKAFTGRLSYRSG
jgi:hypothetical protein